MAYRYGLRYNPSVQDYLQFTFDDSDPEKVSAIDELCLWSAPFGMKILDGIPYRQGMNVLDIGSGLGFPLLEIAMRLGKTSRVYGIDPWETALRRAQKKMRTGGIDHVLMCRGLAEALPFADGSFDLLVSNNGINNVQDLDRTLQECARVAREGAPFLLTFNTEESFLEFYTVYREVLDELDLSVYRERIQEHIRQKRKPVSEMVQALHRAGFLLDRCRSDSFSLCYADGTSLLRHFFVKLAFLGPWKRILPEEQRARVFSRIEQRLNDRAGIYGCLSLQVPFFTLECRRSASSRIL